MRLGNRKSTVHGWLIIDKPLHMTSAQLVARVRRITKAGKIGHAGTLDPLATGVLPLAFGEATKTVAYVQKSQKVYVFTLKFGESRTTDDCEGDITETSDFRPTTEAIRDSLSAFIGDIQQRPPVFSAIKVGGKRSYALARTGQAEKLKARTVHIAYIKILDRPDRECVRLEVACGKGTYIRSLARDLAKAVGSVGHVSALRRTAVGYFGQNEIISLEKLEEKVHSTPIESVLLPVNAALVDIPALRLTDKEVLFVRQGRILTASPSVDKTIGLEESSAEVVCVSEMGVPVALARVVKGAVKPFRVLNI